MVPAGMRRFFLAWGLSLFAVLPLMSKGVPIAAEPTEGNLVTDIVCPPGECSVSSLPGRHRLVVGSESTLSLLPGSESIPARVAGGVVVLGRSGESPSGEANPQIAAMNPLLWYDPSRAATLVALTNVEGVVQTWQDRVCVARMLDVRGMGYYSLYENRVWEDSPPRFIDAILKVYPNVCQDGPNGLAYLSFVGARKRLAFVDADKVSGGRKAYAKFCVMVFGSHGGGGRAMLATEDDSLSRTNVVASSDDPYVPLANPVTTNESVTVWLDGCRQANPSRAYFSGGWQVVSVDLSSLSSPISGLGFSGPSQSSSAGGQEYAEVIFFDRVLEDSDRIFVEDYLSRKWGVGLSRAYAPSSVYGDAGTVRLTGNASLRGGFSGTVDIGAYELRLSDPRGVPTAAEIGAIEGVAGWFDPDDAANRVMQNALKPLEFRYLRDCRKTYAEGDTYLSYAGSSTANRSPNLNVGARGWGGVRAWMDFENIYAGDTDGNYFRFMKAEGQKEVETTVSARMAFVVSDSFRGGGTPVLDVLNAYYSGNIRSRVTNDPSSPIWSSGSSAVITKGNVWLNGERIDSPTTTGFTGQPEVFSFAPTESLGFACLGDFHNSQGTLSGQAEMLGEAIFFDRVLAESDASAVNAYLMWKWIGMLPEGYSDLQAATVIGSGCVSVASADLLPKFAKGFSGTVVTDETDLSFELTGKGRRAEVRNGLDFGAGTLAGGKSYSVVCTLADRPAGGGYRLVSWGSAPADATWSLSVSSDAVSSDSCALRVEDDGLYLDVRGRGMAIFLR